MNEAMTNEVVSLLVQLIVIVAGALAMYLGRKIKVYLDHLKASNSLGMVGMLAERAVAFVESEYQNVPGSIKRSHALELVTKWLGDRGIKVDESEIIAGLEHGVNKLHDLQSKGSKPSSDVSNPEPDDAPNI